MVDVKVKDEVFNFTSNESGVTGTDISANQTSLWLQGWRFQIPVGQTYIFSPADTFSSYMVDLVAAELLVAAKIRILIVDQNRLDTKIILNPVRYTQTTEFQDTDKLCHLDIPSEVIANESDWIYIEVYASVSLDESACWWNLTCRRIRHGIY